MGAGAIPRSTTGHRARARSPFSYCLVSEIPSLIFRQNGVGWRRGSLRFARRTDHIAHSIFELVDAGPGHCGNGKEGKLAPLGHRAKLLELVWIGRVDLRR